MGKKLDLWWWNLSQATLRAGTQEAEAGRTLLVSSEELLNLSLFFASSSGVLTPVLKEERLMSLSAGLEYKGSLSSVFPPVEDKKIFKCFTRFSSYFKV